MNYGKSKEELNIEKVAAKKAATKTKRPACQRAKVVNITNTTQEKKKKNLNTHTFENYPQKGKFQVKTPSTTVEISYEFIEKKNPYVTQKLSNDFVSNMMFNAYCEEEHETNVAEGAYGFTGELRFETNNANIEIDYVFEAGDQYQCKTKKGKWNCTKKLVFQIDSMYDAGYAFVTEKIKPLNH